MITAVRVCVCMCVCGNMWQAQRRPYRTAALLRAAYMPMPVKNYGLALLGVPPAPYVITLIPLELLDTYLPVAIGSSAHDLAALLRGELPAGESRERVVVQLVLVGFAALATAGLLAALGVVAKRAIEQARQRAREEREII